MNTYYAIIVAGGSGSRMKSSLPKQFIELSGTPVLMRTIQVFASFREDIKIIVVLPEDQIVFWKTLCQKHHFHTSHHIVSGGSTRFQSVKNGLSQVKDEGLVAIHDGVRPLVSRDTLTRCFDLASREGNAIPSLPIYESVRCLEKDRNEMIDRNALRLIQTPQVFSCRLIKEAYDQDYDQRFTDDASVLESKGHIIHLAEGNRENIKITDPYDLRIANALLHP